MQHPESDEVSQTEQRLDDILTACGMKRHAIEGDGNCCFSAVAFSLIINSSQTTPDIFSNLQLDLTGDLHTVSMQLRSLAVDEWTQNPQDYEGFVPVIDIQQEATKFLQSGYFYGDLADTIVLALSNSLGLPFIIFSSSMCQPVITITPRHLKSPIPIYLAFNQSGAGHYDSVVLCASPIKPLAVPSSTRISDDGPCSCGKNDKMNKSHCHPITSKYTTVVYCKCCKNNKPCTNMCKCKMCKNPFGTRKITADTSEVHVSRKRPRHQWQIHVSKSVKFAIDVGEDVNTGSRSMLEFFVLESILKHCLQEKIEIIPANIEKIFNAIVEIADTLDVKLQIGRKSLEHIKCFLREHDHTVHVFKALCFAQLENECTQ